MYDPYFGIDPSNSQDGGADLGSLEGLNNSYLPWVDGHTWNYTGENSYMDRLVLHSSPPDNGAPEVYLRNPSTGYNHGVINQGTYNTLTYHTVAHAFELGSLTQTSRGAVAETLAAYILRNAFGVQPTVVQETPMPNLPQPALEVWPALTRGQATVHFTLPQAEAVTLERYYAAGRRIRRLWTGRTQSRHIQVSTQDLPTGVYLVRLTPTQGTPVTRRLVVLH